jgi:hypothetical protein
MATIDSRAALFAAVLGLLLFVGCSRKIGDECSTNIDCGVGRICDRSQPGGYCTIPDCDTGSCPADSVCIRFSNGQSFCMLACGGNSDCRKEYTCVTGVGVFPFCNASPAPGAVGINTEGIQLEDESAPSTID